MCWPDNVVRIHEGENGNNLVNNPYGALHQGFLDLDRRFYVRRKKLILEEPVDKLKHEFLVLRVAVCRDFNAQPSSAFKVVEFVQELL